MRFQAPESLSEQIAQHLGQPIVTGNLPAAAGIRELEVAEKLNVSRSSVPEASLIFPRRQVLGVFCTRVRGKGVAG